MQAGIAIFPQRNDQRRGLVSAYRRRPGLFVRLGWNVGDYCGNELLQVSAGCRIADSLVRASTGEHRVTEPIISFPELFRAESIDRRSIRAGRAYRHVIKICCLAFRSQSLVRFLGEAHRGVRGFVLDANGRPLENVAMKIKGRDAPFQTTKHGEFWRLLLPGYYRIEVCNIYRRQSRTGVHSEWLAALKPLHQ